MCYKLNFEVRDYECDLQGIVNNSVYQNYFEHARHKFIKYRGIDFAEMHNQGKDLVLTEANLKYKVSLKSGDEFITTLKFEKQGRIKYKFYQKIINLDGKICVVGEFTAVCLVNVRPTKCKEVDELLL